MTAAMRKKTVRIECAKSSCTAWKRPREAAPARSAKRPESPPPEVLSAFAMRSPAAAGTPRPSSVDSMREVFWAVRIEPKFREVCVMPRRLAVARPGRPVDRVGAHRPEHEADAGPGERDPDPLRAEREVGQLRGPEREADRGERAARP
jgi:hypothetical protein